MNSLLNYGSDDDCDDSSEEKQTDWRGTASKDNRQQSSSHRESDANYEEVQMDLSEESNDSPKEAAASRRSRDRDSKDRRDRHHHDDHRSSSRRDKDSKSRNDKDDRYNHHRRGDRDARKSSSRRSSSRERRRSRTPPRRAERDSKQQQQQQSSKSRSRSRSKERSSGGWKYSKRYDPGGSSGKSRQPERNNESQKADSEEKRSTPTENDRFFMPGITGRFRDQIERRKQLWQKKVADPKDNNTNGQSKKVWETTTFAQDTDGKVANKFKRLMGIKGPSEATGAAVDVLKKQEEMFSSMEQQYEVARTATHTMRGVGLGFGSYQR